MPETAVARRPLGELDGAALHRWCVRAVEELGVERGEIDALNVFPVPDGDTGTNLFQTMESAASELDRVTSAAGGLAGGRPDLAAVVGAIARGAFLGARGNSGVILSQMLRGIAEAVTTRPGLSAVDGPILAAALERASASAYAAVGAPVEGTMLTVVRAAADAALAVRPVPAELLDVVVAAHAAARAHLADSPNHLAVLRRYGVVDAGGAGVVVLLRVLEELVAGVRPTSASRVPHPRPNPGAGPGVTGADLVGPAYEVMYLLEADEPAVEALRSTLCSLGDSLLVVGGDGLWNVHVHVDDPGAAVEAGVVAGRPYRVRISHLEASPDICAPASHRTVIVVAEGGGVAAIAQEAGAIVVPAEPPPLSHELATAVRAAMGLESLLLVTGDSGRSAAAAAAHTLRGEGFRVAVLPMRSVVQVLSALAVHDPARGFEDDLVSMTAAARSTRTATVVVAKEPAATMAGVCAAGDVLGLVEGEVVHIGSDVLDVATALATMLLTSGGELVTVVHGRDTARGVATELAEAIRRDRPGVECDVYDGGQERELLVLGVE